MHVVTAESLGMCFGVRDAVELALRSPHRTELTVLGELVHNDEVSRRLREAGVRSVPSLDARVPTHRVLITAHGASDRAISRLRSHGLVVEEATCPLVRHAHKMLRRLVDQGYFPVVIGRPDHVEVRGMIEDYDDYDVITGPNDLPRLAGRDRIGVVSQTTQPLDAVLALVDQIRAAYPNTEVRFIDTVCAPTKERQIAARRLASRCAVVVVVGGRNSNNTRQLVRACEAEGARAYQVESAADLRPEWFDGYSEVGLTAGTSTPDETIEEVRSALRRIGTRELAAA